MTALAIVATFTRREQREVASNDDAYRPLGIIAEFDHRTAFRPSYFQGGPVLGVDWSERQQAESEPGRCDDAVHGNLRWRCNR
jgi:hypothetical protein